MSSIHKDAQLEQLAEWAYMAYVDNLDGGASLPGWSEITNGHRDAWLAVASTVREAVQDDIRNMGEDWFA